MLERMISWESNLGLVVCEYLLGPHVGDYFFEFMQMFGKILPKLVYCVTEIQNTIMYNDWTFSRLDELNDDTEIQFILDLHINQ